MVTLEDLTVPPPPPGPADWNDDGVLLLPGVLSENVMAAYEMEWLAANGDRPGGWPVDTPYRSNPALNRMVTDSAVASALESLMGEPAGVHLNLTPWVSTERDWHQDAYLNPPHVGDFYAAVWFSLQDIDPESGPFQYVRGSHRWPQVTRERIGKHVNLSDPRWPKHSEDVLSPLFEQEILKRNAEITTHLPARGDVLIWHGRLLHRGSTPNVRGTERRACIAHYSGISHRFDMPRALQRAGSGWEFPL